jgi:FkbM family methyltransferase
MKEKVFPLIKKAKIVYHQEGLFQLCIKILNMFLDQYSTIYKHYVLPVKIVIGGTDMSLSYNDKYILEDSKYPVVPDDTDIVLEVGAYHGRDTAMMAKLAEYVYAFEPSPRNFSTLEKNLESFDNITLIQKGVFNESGKLELEYGKTSDDDGFLAPDSGSAEKKRTEVPVDTLESHVESLNIDTVDFLKVEAEGAEPEVLKGIGELNIEKIVVAAGTERDGKSTGKQVTEILKELGYSLVGSKRGHILFFKLNTDSSRAFEFQ